MKEDFSVDELLKMLRSVKKEKEELDKNEGNEFTIRDYEVLIYKLERNIIHEIKNN